MRLKSYEFRKERQATWAELERLVRKVERWGVTRLTEEQLARLPVLYHATLSSLSVARAISLDRALLLYLESLCSRAYFCVYSPKRHFLDVIAEFALERFPATVRLFKWHVALAALFMVLGTITAYVLTSRNTDWFYTFVDEAYAQGRGPAASTEDLRAVLYGRGGAGEGGAGALSHFASFLFTHNALIGMSSFAFGFAAGVPVYFLMFMNGLILGAFAALYESRGLGIEFWAWILPHGVTELTAIVFCGAGGLVLAQALVFPGRHTRLANLAARGRRAGVLLMGAVAMLFVAAVIEGYFRQLVQSVSTRLLVAFGTAALWILYFTFVGRGRGAAESRDAFARSREEPA